jgi:hypothetical protein
MVPKDIEEVNVGAGLYVSRLSIARELHGVRWSRAGNPVRMTRVPANLQIWIVGLVVVQFLYWLYSVSTGSYNATFR